VVMVVDVAMVMVDVVTVLDRDIVVLGLGIHELVMVVITASVICVITVLDIMVLDTHDSVIVALAASMASIDSDTTTGSVTDALGSTTCQERQLCL